MPVKNNLTFRDIRDNSTSEDLFSGRYRLELNPTVRLLNILSLDTPHVIAQQQFTKNEWSIFLTLLSNYPHYASLENLLASLTLLSLEDCRTRIQVAQIEGSQALKRELKPVHRAISGIRTKFKQISPQLQISFIHDVGYILTFNFLDDLCKDCSFVKIVFSGETSARS
jgi:hypothetical protein